MTNLEKFIDFEKNMLDRFQKDYQNWYNNDPENNPLEATLDSLKVKLHRYRISYEMLDDDLKLLISRMKK